MNVLLNAEKKDFKFESSERQNRSEKEK